MRLATDREGWCRGFAHVHFEEAAGAAQAVRLSGTLLAENSVRVERASDEADAWDDLTLTLTLILTLTLTLTVAAACDWAEEARRIAHDEVPG